MTRDRNHRQSAMSGDRWEIIRIARSTAQSNLHLTITMNSKAAEGIIMSHHIITGRTETNFLQMRLGTNQIIIEEVVNESGLINDPVVARIAADVGRFLDRRLHGIGLTVDPSIIALTVDPLTIAPTADPSMTALTVDQSTIAQVVALLTSVPTVDPLMIGLLNSNKRVPSRLLQVGAMTSATATNLRPKATLKLVASEM